MKPPFAINGWDRGLPLERTTILQNSLSHRSGHWSLRFWASNSFLCSWQYGFQDFGIPEPTMSPLGWYQNSSQRTNVLKLFRNRWEFPGIRHGSLVPKDLERLLCLWEYLDSTWLDPRIEQKRIHNRNSLCITPRTPGSSLSTSDVG